VLDNGHAYVTDAGGRVKEVTGDLSLNKMERNTYQQGCAGASGCAGDDGGHLIASSLGGAGDRVNIVPQAATLNRQDWKDMENYLRGELQAGKNVSVKIDVGYPGGGGVRPDSFLVEANINRPLKKSSSNAPGSWISKKRVAQTRPRSKFEGHFGLFAGRFARFGRTYPMAHA